MKTKLEQNGWHILPSDPLKLTIDACCAGTNGTALAQMLHEKGIECEFSDPETVVLMLTPENTQNELVRLHDALGRNSAAPQPYPALPSAKGESILSVRDAVFAAHETVSVQEALGRICGAPTVACPPAIPIAVSGEIITQEAIVLFEHYSISTVDVIR